MSIQLTSKTVLIAAGGSGVGLASHARHWQPAPCARSTVAQMSDRARAAALNPALP